jgi:hypothetical protein
MADLPINTLIYGSQVRPAVGPVVQPQYAPVPMPDPRRQAQPIAAPSNAVATATDTGGNGFFDNLTAGFSDPLTLMGMQMIGNGGMSVGAPRPMFQGVPQTLEAAQGMKLREEQAQQKKAEQEAEAERKRLLAETIIPQLPPPLHELARVDPEGALAIYQQMQPKEQGLVNAGGGQLYNPNTGEWILAPSGNAQPEAIADAQNREVLADQYGLQGAARQSFILTGKLPGADGGAPMNATVMNQIFEADSIAQASQDAIGSLERALVLSKEAYDGPMADMRGTAGALFGDRGGQATVELTNEVMSQALSQLKSIFGAAPTEGERKILLDIQGSADKPRAVREAIYKRGIEAAQRRLEFNRNKAQALRSGTYFDPGYGTQQSTGGTTGTGIDDLLTKYGV